MQKAQNDLNKRFMPFVRFVLFCGNLSFVPFGRGF
jgi:hypothetical protein